MKVGVFSDIHANWHALQAVLEDAGDIEAGLCLGDVVGYGAEPNRCLDEIRERGWPTLVGNHDRACTDERILSWFNEEAAEVIRWTRDRLGEERLAWLASLPETIEQDGALLVHGSPRDPIFEYVLDIGTAFVNLELLDGRPCLHGHTHVAGYFYPSGESVEHAYWLGRIRVAGPALINPGSVGQPRDGIREASYGVWDTEASTFEWRRVDYDREAAKKAILKARLPRRFAARLDVGR